MILDFGTTELPNGVVWLTGMNGAGKSTLMQCAAGILPFNGDITLMAKRCSLKKNPVNYRLHVNIGEAEPVFPAFLKGVELIQFFSEAKRGNDQQVSTLIDRLFARSFIQERVGTYSSGMTKKLSLILAFVGNPAVILLDEPLITLDQPTQAALCTLIAEKADQGVDFLLSSHQELALEAPIAIQQCSLNEGKLTPVN